MNVVLANRMILNSENPPSGKSSFTFATDINKDGKVEEIGNLELVVRI